MREDRLIASICPVLHHPDAFDTKRYASRFLVDCDVNVPVVSYLRTGDDGESIYVSWKALKKNKSGLGGLDDKAMNALIERSDRQGWDPVSVNYRGSRATIMRRIGDFFTASDVMDPEMMEILHNYFGSQTVFVGIPHACYMVASTLPEYIFEDFFLAYDEAKAEGVQFFEHVYRIDDGHISEVLDAMPIGPAPQMKTVKNEGVLWFTQPYRSNYKHLDYMIRADADHYVPLYCQDPDFGGKVIFEIPAEAPPFSPEETRKVGQLEALLNAIVEENGWITLAGQPVMIRIRFSQRVQTVSALDPQALRRLKKSAQEYDDKQRQVRSRG